MSSYPLLFTSMILPGHTVRYPSLVRLMYHFRSQVSQYVRLKTINCVCIQVPNYLPSISASISLSPESHIWRFCIGLHSAPRVLVAFSYFSLYNARFDSKFPESLLTCLNLAFSMCENLGLLLLTYVSSSETYCE